MADRPVPTGYGAFCWSQLNATDPAACEAFYTKLLGWSAAPERAGGASLTLFTRGKDEVATLLEIPAGTPRARSHWMSYVWVEDVDASFARALSLGAAAFVPPSPIPGVGRFAVIGDPTGATLGLYQQNPPADPSRPLPAGAGTFCWYELATRERDAALAFYGALFGWTAQPMGLASVDYTLLFRGEELMGGLMAISGPEWEGVPNHWMPYVAVADVDARAAAVPTLGGSGCVPPTDIPDVGRFAVVGDPTGGVISLLQPL
ncbi:VOC family protein [Geothrix sp. 21YS21S-4]|uniref:VOC family protein n=1 Tax=Geothrix sp. 21YS21S-4 TaxID=3068889 RepID=UPI0027BA7F71|nr:VOC family protein [Geothrix sp. 21YS21S-4]